MDTLHDREKRFTTETTCSVNLPWRVAAPLAPNKGMRRVFVLPGSGYRVKTIILADTIPVCIMFSIPQMLLWKP